MALPWGEHGIGWTAFATALNSVLAKSQDRLANVMDKNLLLAQPEKRYPKIGMLVIIDKMFQIPCLFFVNDRIPFIWSC